MPGEEGGRVQENRKCFSISVGRQEHDREHVQFVILQFFPLILPLYQSILPRVAWIWGDLVSRMPLQAKAALQQKKLALAYDNPNNMPDSRGRRRQGLHWSDEM